MNDWSCEKIVYWVTHLSVSGSKEIEKLKKSIIKSKQKPPHSITLSTITTVVPWNLSSTHSTFAIFSPHKISLTKTLPSPPPISASSSTASTPTLTRSDPKSNLTSPLTTMISQISSPSATTPFHRPLKSPMTSTPS